MKNNTIFAFLALGCLSSRLLAADLTHYVNPMIGTLPGSGNTYPGAQLPFGMISWSPHTLEWSAAGYNYKNDHITGFGLVHSSGVGCGATCELPFVFCTGDLAKSPVTSPADYTSVFSHSNEVARPGYYSVALPAWDINFETTVKARSGIAHVDYPAAGPANVIFNPGADTHGAWDSAIYIDPTNQLMTGWVKSGEFCQCKKNDYTIYFAAQFDRSFQEYGTWTKGQKNESAGSASGRDVAGYVSFKHHGSQRITMKVGISFVSMANARLNLNQEIPGWNFSGVEKAAKKEWNDHLARIQVEGGLPEDNTIFYTALYHSLMMPSIFEDVNGEYCGMDGAVHTVVPGHHFLATFSGWDTYRTQAQLWGLLYPDMASDFCQSFLNMARQSQYQGGGGLPLWSLFNDETRIMIGYPADPYIANAYAFGATNFDVAALEKVMVDSARNQRWCGRNVNVTWDYLPEYERDGYCANDVMPAACSRNVEYSVADFAVAQMCKNLGDQTNYEYFLNRSQSVFNLVNTNHGYMQCRNRDGSWVMPFDRFSGAGFTEGNSAQYTWTVPHSLNKLIRLAGGKVAADAKLDELTSHLASGYDYTSKYYEAGNEPCFGVMPVYNWLQKPWKAQDKLRTVMLNCFANNSGGIPGDDDSGAMSAWYIFGALGWYPEIPGVGGVTLTSPLFPKATVTLPNGKTIVITAANASRDARYIQSMNINGQPNSKLWLTVDQLKNGAKLDYVMGTTPNVNWGVGKNDQPPSLEPDKYQAYAPKMPATKSILVFDLTKDLSYQTWEAKEAYMICTVIQGIVNRTSAEKIYFTHSPQEHAWKPAPTDQFMLDDGIVPVPRTTPALDAAKKFPVLSYLLAHYKSYIKGKVWCPDLADPNWDKDSAIMAAITACGIEDAIPVTTASDAYVAAEGLKLEAKADTRNLKTKTAAYQWAKANYFQAATSRKVVGFHSYTAFPEQNYIADQFPITYDYLIANRSFVICSDDAKVLDDLMNPSDYPSGAFVFGLPTNEGMMVMMEKRGYPFEICNLPNLTVLSSFPTDFDYKPTAPVAESTIDTNGAYVAFFMTDGDSLGFSGSFHYDKLRNSPARGAYPIGWSTSILLNDLMPTYIKWRSENTYDGKYEILADSFHVSVPSDYGYGPFLKFHQDVFANAKGLFRGAVNLFYTTPQYTRFINDVQPDLFIPGYCGNRNGNPVAWSYTGSNKVLTTRLSGATQTQADSGALLERAARTAIDAQPAGQPAFVIVTAGDARHSGDSVAFVKAAADALKANPGKRNWHFLRPTDLTATYKKYIRESGGVSLNQAYLKDAVASSADNADNPAKNAVDGRGRNGTRWASQGTDPQWIYVDLGAVKPVDRVVLDWESAYGKAFQIQVSNDANNWSDVYSTTNGTGGINDISFPSTDARYVRMYGTKRGTGYGYSLWEFEVYAAPQAML